MENRVLSVGIQFPEFEKLAVVSLMKGLEFELINHRTHIEEGQWMVMFWWPKDFSSLCPTEVAEFNRNFDEFVERDTVLLGASTDSEFVHRAWRDTHEALRDLQFPMIADTSKSLAQDLGILENGEKVAYRATFIVDPHGIIRWVSVNELAIGRNVKEVLRVLDALQSSELCPCNWEKGQPTLGAYK